jgi:hypothetical protein
VDDANIGGILYTLPYMEQDAVYRNFDNPAPPTMYWMQNVNNMPAETFAASPPPPPTPRTLYGADAKIKTLVCPSATPPESTATALLLCPQSRDNVRWTVSTKFGQFSPAGFRFARPPAKDVINKSHYVLMGGYPFFDADGDSGPSSPGQFEGPFMYNSKTTIAGISDGSSNTILAGEYGDCNVDYGAGDSRTGECSGTMAGAYLYTYWSIRGGEATDSRPNYVWYKFGGKHTGITQFVFGDGSVRGLRNSIDYTTWVVLGGKADGWVLRNE